MCTAHPESLRWPMDRLLLAWARQMPGHQVRELASSPLAQVAPLGGVGADTGLMESSRQTGAYQTACDHNQQWQRTMNAIIYKKTVQVSFSFSLLRLFTPTLFLRGSMKGLWPCQYSRQQGVFIVPRATLLFIAVRPDVQLQPVSYQLRILARGEGRHFNHSCKRKKKKSTKLNLNEYIFL